MLSKDICKKCWNRFGGWVSSDDFQWEIKERIVCPGAIRKHVRYESIKVIPDCCIYQLEHLMESQKM